MTTTMSPSRVTEMFKRAFGLRDGIKSLALTVTKEEVALAVVYHVPDAESGWLIENLEEFELVRK